MIRHRADTAQIMVVAPVSQRKSMSWVGREKSRRGTTARQAPAFKAE